jgi:hypothetical protein
MSIARVRLADLSCEEGVATAQYLSAVRSVFSKKPPARCCLKLKPRSQVNALSGSLKSSGAVLVVLDSATTSAVDDVHVSSASFFKAPAAAKKKHAAKSDVYGATGFRQLSGKQVFDTTLGDTNLVPDVLACTAPRAYARLSVVGRTVLGALSWSLQAGATGQQAADFAALCEPMPLPPHRKGASLLSLFSYQASSGGS